MHEMIERAFYAWVDEALGRAPKNIPAFHFNLYEGVDSVHVQLWGTSSFTPGDDYWPGEEVFSTGEAIFEVPFEMAGGHWEEWLQSLMALVTRYLANGTRASILRQSQGVGIGFVDGDMYVLWPAPAA